MSTTETRQSTTENITLNSGENRLLRVWPSPVPSKTMLFIQHGLGEHSGRYQSIADAAAKLPIHIVSFDSVGHGLSPGRRGDAGGLSHLANDFAEVLAIATAKFGVSRVILLGHSMGGAVLATYIAERAHKQANPKEAIPREVSALIFSAPAMVVPRSLSTTIKLAIGRVLGRVVPTLTLGSGLDANGISTDESEIKRYREDPYNHSKISARLGVAIVDDAQKALPGLRACTLPALVYQGAEDPIVDPKSAGAVRDALGGTVEYHLFPGLKHEVHHEVSAGRAVWESAFIRFLSAHLQSQP